MVICSFGYATDGLVAFSFRSWEQIIAADFLLWRAHTNFQMLAKGVTQKVKVQQLRPIMIILPPIPPIKGTRFHSIDTLVNLLEIGGPGAAFAHRECGGPQCTFSNGEEGGGAVPGSSDPPAWMSRWKLVDQWLGSVGYNLSIEIIPKITGSYC